MDSCRTRFEALMRESVEGEPPLRFFVFGRRANFEAFFRRASLVPGNLDGVYAPWEGPHRIAHDGLPRLPGTGHPEVDTNPGHTTSSMPTGSARLPLGSRSGSPK